MFLLAYSEALVILLFIGRMCISVMQWKKEFGLELMNIENVTDSLRDILKKCKCTDRDIVRAQLFTEETILFWSKAASVGDTFQIEIRKRLKTISLILSCKGMQADPLAKSDSEADEEFNFIGQNILIGLSTVTYNYEKGCNIVAFTIKGKGINPVVSLVFALVAAVICGLAVQSAVPDFASVLSTSLLTPLRSRPSITC